MFDINLSDKLVIIENEPLLSGSINTDSLMESFHASASYWDRGGYLNQWKKALEVLINGGEKSALITGITEPKSANFIRWWILYSQKDDIYLQEHVLFLDSLKENFNEQRFVEFVPERDVETEYGEKISEWKVSIDDIKVAYKKLCDDLTVLTNRPN